MINSAYLTKQKVFEKNGVETEIVYLGKKPVAGCVACGICRKAGYCYRRSGCKSEENRTEILKQLLKDLLQLI